MSAFFGHGIVSLFVLYMHTNMRPELLPTCENETERDVDLLDLLS
jgi:hypothetical protein